MKDLDKLALKLSMNHITNSLGDDSETVLKEIMTEANSADISDTDKNTRYIMIIGAGASKSVCNMIETAANASKQMKQYVIDQRGQLAKQLIEDELDKLSQIYRLERDDFETVFFACNKFFPEEVKEKLTELYGKKYEVSLFYEIISHMLKHRFLDVVINYNFDEILDNAIEEELQDTKYPTIYSDGHCPKMYSEDLLNPDKAGLMHPLYIKPHGTISHYSTLRFTRESYFNISNEISDLIRKLLSGKGPFSDHRRYDINLILVGFSMKSFELNQIIKDVYKHDISHNSLIAESSDTTETRKSIKTYIFDTAAESSYQSNLDKEFQEIFEIKYFQVSKKKSLDQYFAKLWSQIDSNYRLNYKPKGIARHLIIGEILTNKTIATNGFDRNYRKYFRFRTYLEIALSILSADVLLNSTLIRDSRIQKYYGLFKQAGGAEKLSDMLSDMGLVEYQDYVKDTYHLADRRSTSKDNSALVYQNLLKSFRKFSSEAESLYQYVSSVKSKKTIIELFQDLNHRNLLSVRYDERVLLQSKFENLTPGNLIRTDLDWSFRYRNYFHQKSDDWTLLMAVSEMGRFLGKEVSSKIVDHKSCEIIIADLADPSIVNSPLQIDDKINTISGSILQLPWWLHNQHLVLFAKRSNARHAKNGFLLTKGFYYTSRLLKRVVSPIEITNQEDLRVLLEIFITYRLRALSYMNSKKASIVIPLSRDSINSGIDDFFESIGE